MKSDYVHVKLHQFEDLPDDELVELVHNGDTDALDFLITKYRSFVRMKAQILFFNWGR